MGRVVGEIGDQRLAEALDRELRRAVRGVCALGIQSRPETVDAAGVDQVRIGACEQHRHERPGTVVDAEPADVEGALPLVAGIAREASTAGDARVVEQQVDMVGVVGGLDRVAERVDLVFVGHVAMVRADEAPLARISHQGP